MNLLLNQLLSVILICIDLFSSSSSLNQNWPNEIHNNLGSLLCDCRSLVLWSSMAENVLQFGVLRSLRSCLNVRSRYSNVSSNQRCLHPNLQTFYKRSLTYRFLCVCMQNPSIPYLFSMKRGILLLLLFYTGLLPFVPLGESVLLFYLPRVINRSVYNLALKVIS